MQSKEQAGKLLQSLQAGIPNGRELGWLENACDLFGSQGLEVRYGHNPVEEVLLRTEVLHGGWSLVRLLGWKGAAVWSIHQLRRWSWNGLRKASRGGAGS